ncbi:MAG: OmpA family protein [Williamsia sp.]|nr:OmpA family protein [Williamsia sp.]
MASKKYSFFTGILCLFALGTFAQTTTGYDVLDSSLISKKNLPQHNEFKNNAYPFPAKPRDQWEIGVKVGSFAVSGDIPATIPTAGFGVHVRKALGYVFSVRAEYLYGMAKGLNWKSRTNGFSSSFSRYTAGTPIYDNYKTTLQDFSIEGIASLNNIKFHKDKSSVEVYLIGGLGAAFFSSKVNALNGNALYNFASVAGNSNANKKDTKKALKNLLDDSYETSGESNGNQQQKLFGLPFTPTASVGAGLAFKLSKRINLALEDRFSFTTTDLLDGQRYQNIPGVTGAKTLSGDKDAFNYLTVGLNINLGKHAIEPLWWVNPLDYAYNEINQPKHMKLPKPVLDDADGDGITDQFDQEPNTPANAPVDSHGVSRDTDGDGVPDYKDKELVTPTQCQPVNADGVGNCPPPACCNTLDSLIKSGWRPGGTCGIGDLPSVSFKGRTIALSNDAKAVLAGVAERMRTNAQCRVAVVGYGESNKAAQQLSWDRVNAVINYMVEKEGLSQDRFVFKYGQAEGAADTVDLKEATADDVPNSVPAPSPNLRRRK